MPQVPVYDPAVIEPEWQARWAAEHTNEPDLDRPTRPFYNLMMFPYPSAEGLHVGNMYAFTGADVYGRWRKLSGDDVFEPIGFGASGRCTTGATPSTRPIRNTTDGRSGSSSSCTGRAWRRRRWRRSTGVPPATPSSPTSR